MDPCNRHLKDQNDLGRIVDLSNSLDWEKNENYQPVTSFTQRQLNHLRLGYQPPRKVFQIDELWTQFDWLKSSTRGRHGVSINLEIY